MHLDIDKVAMREAFRVSTYSKCRSRHVGAMVLIYHDGKPLGFFGFSGPMNQEYNCNSDCLREHSNQGEQLYQCRGVHAEEHLFMTHTNLDFIGSTIYLTDSPCPNCARLITNRGFKRVVYCRTYPGIEVSADLLRLAGIQLDHIEEETLWD